MKKIWLVAVGVVLLIGVVFLAGCGSNGINGTLELKGNLYGQQEGIWVSGTGKVYAIPDNTEITLGIEAQAVSVAEAQAKATTAMDKVVKALKDAGIDDKDIQTQYFNINEITKWETDKNESITTGYRVTNTVVVKVREVKKTGAIIDAVVVAGGDYTRINGINFTVEDPNIYYAQAREKAVTYAKAKAEQMASLTGVKLGKVTYTSESSYMPSSNYYNGRVEAAAPAIDTTSISAGQLEITTTVQIAYSIAD
ncbi:MAG: SIMPL domain-containing protein [Dehalococcoidales bacterium]